MLRNIIERTQKKVKIGVHFVIYCFALVLYKSDIILSVKLGHEWKGLTYDSLGKLFNLLITCTDMLQQRSF